MNLAGHEEENISFFCEKLSLCSELFLNCCPSGEAQGMCLLGRTPLYSQKTLWDILYKDFRLLQLKSTPPVDWKYTSVISQNFQE